MKISEKRKAGAILERAGIAQRIINIATEISEGNYIDAIIKAGQIKELVDCLSFDDYWNEKSQIGMQKEQHIFGVLIRNPNMRDRVSSSGSVLKD